MADSDSQRNPVELLAEEFLERYRRGERPALSEYTARHPDHAAEIRELFPLLVQMEGAAPDPDEDQASLGAGQDAEHPQPSQIGDYRIVREIGRGGMGVVYEAQQQSLGRRVALKVLPLHASKDDTALKRFRREARAAAKLHHTNIVPVFDVGEQGETCYYAMQFIQGQPLDVVIHELRRQRKTPEKPGEFPDEEIQTEAIDPAAEDCARSLLTGHFARQNFKDTPPSPDLTAPLDPRHETASVPRQIEPSAFAHGDAALSPAAANDRYYFRSVAQIGRQAADALAYAHSRGVIHRDIKPSNLLLDAAGVIWISDFGMAKIDDDALTHTGDILGTLRYMAPERFQGDCDARADIYALGLTLYELLVLKPAFDSSDRLRLVEMISRHALRPPRALDPRIPRDLETIVLKATEKDPRRRYQTAEEFADDLQRFTENRPIQARRIGGTERFVRWWQRNPVAASLSVGMVVLLVSVAVVSTFVAYDMHEQAARESGERKRAEIAEQTASANADRARARGQKSEQRAEMLRREDYVNRVKLAYWESLNDDVARANELLEGCPEDLRGWEWEFVRRQCGDLAPLRSFHESAESVNCIAFSPDGKRLAMGTGTFFSRRYSRGDLVVLDATTGEVLLAHRGLPGTVSAVAFSPDGSRIASGNGPDLTVWDAATGERLHQLPNDPLEVLSVAFSPDGRRLLAGYGRFNGDEAGYAKVIDADTGKLLREPIPGHTGGVWAVAFHPDGKRAALTSKGLVEVCNLEEGKVVQALRDHHDFVYAAAYSSCGRFLATGGLDKTIRLWDAETGALLRTFAGHRGFVRSVAFSPDNSRIVSASEDKSLKLWDIRSDRELATYHGHTQFVNCVAFSREGLFASGGLDQSVKVWFPALEQQLTYEGHRNKGHVRGLAFSPSGNAVASGSLFFDAPTDRLHLWNPATGEQLVPFPQNIGAIASIAFSPDGSVIAAGQENGDITLWEAATGGLIRRLENHFEIVSALAFSPDGTRLASGGEDAAVNLWDPAEGTLVAALVGHRDAVRALDFSPDGRTLATAGEDGAVILWNAEDATELRRLEGHVGVVWSVAFSPDGKWIASGGGIDHRLGDLRLWERETGTMVRQLKGHTDIVFDLAFSPDSSRLASACDDRTVKLWNPQTGREVFTLRGHTGGVATVAFSPDGRRIASGSVDRTVKVWDLDRPDAALLHRRDVVALLERGREHLDRNEWEQALGAFLRASEMGLDHAELHRLRGIANLRLGRVVESDADFARALELTPDDPHALCKLGTLLAGLERAEPALSALNRATQLAPEDREVLLALARAQAQFGRGDSADEGFRRAVAALEEQSPKEGATRARRLATGWWVTGPYPRDARNQEQIGTSPSVFRPDRHAPAGEQNRVDTKWASACQEGDGYLNLGAVFGSAEPAVGYALEHVYATEDHPVALLLGSNDALQLYLNGELVRESRGAQLPQYARDAVPAMLRRGWNTLLARVESAAPRHGLYVHLSDGPGHLARAYTGTGDLDAVIRVWEQADEGQRGDSQLLWLAGNAFARRGRWNEAAAVFERLCERQPARNRNWVVLAPLLAAAGDRNAYDQLCQELISRFGHADDPIIAERTAKACLLLPRAVASDDPAAQLAEHAVAVGAEHRFFKYFQFAGGMAQFRRGDFPAAAQTTAASRRLNAGADPYLEAVNCLVEAMACRRQASSQEADALLQQAMQVIEQQLPSPDGGDLSPAWTDWLICQIVLREAEELFASTAASPAPDGDAPVLPASDASALKTPSQ